MGPPGRPGAPGRAAGSEGAAGRRRGAARARACSARVVFGVWKVLYYKKDQNMISTVTRICTELLYVQVPYLRNVCMLSRRGSLGRDTLTHAAVQTADLQ